jgi:hypothetical protein
MTAYVQNHIQIVIPCSTLVGTVTSEFLGFSRNLQCDLYPEKEVNLFFSRETPLVCNAGVSVPFTTTAGF